MASKYRFVNFGDICEHSAFGPRFSSDEYATDGNVACLRTMDMDFSGRINFDEMPLAQLDLSRLQNHILRRDDLVITRTGAYLGKAAVFTQFRLPVVAGAFSIYFRLNRRLASPVFVRYFFNSSAGQAATRSIATGSAQPNLNIPLLHSIKVPLPPLPAQRKIASILSAYDDLIENNIRRIAILEEMAQAIYREWFVNFRFPGHEKVKMVDSALGKIPQGWKVVNLFDVSEVAYGFPYKSKQFSTEPLGKPVIRIRDILGHKSDTYTAEDAGDKYTVTNGDILIGMDGDFHMCRWAGGEAVLNQRVARLRTKGKLPQYVVFHCVRGPISHFNATIVGTTVAHLGDKHLREINVLLPPSDLLSELHSLFQPLFLKEINLRKKNELLRNTRDLLLPKLISGQLDVKAIDIETCEELAALAT